MPPKATACSRATSKASKTSKTTPVATLAGSAVHLFSTGGAALQGGDGQVAGSQASKLLGGTSTLLVSACTTSTLPCAGGIYYVSGTPLPTASSTFTAMSLTIPSTAYLGQIVINGAALYMGSDSATAGGLMKWTASTPVTVSSTWTAYTWPVSATAYKNAGSIAGVHGLAGRVEGSTYALY